MSNFWQRTITGALFVVLMMGAIYLGYAFWLFLLVTALSLFEFYKMAHNGGNTTAKIYGIAGGIIAYVFIVMVFMHPFKFAGIRFTGRPDALAFLLPCFIGIMLAEFFSKHPDPVRNLSVSVFGWIYIAMPFAIACVIDYEGAQAVYSSFEQKAFLERVGSPKSSSNIPFLILILLLVWCNDVFAYLIGRFTGKTPLAPSISPKKTIEGTLGGVAATLIAAWLLRPFLPFPYRGNIVFAMLLGVVIALSGLVGDLIESKFKRQAGVKDSGNLLPGHGGVLDRFDSFLFVIPSVYMLTEVIRWGIANP